MIHLVLVGLEVFHGGFTMAHAAFRATLYRRRASSFTSSTTVFRSSSRSSTEGAQKTLASGSHQAEMVVKKSQFIGYAQHVETWKEAQAYIDSIKRAQPKARHWCYGFRAGTDPVTERCSDDGEPTGTAGLPILGAIKGEDISDAVVVVVRYFGGIKLGAGGLIRAYGSAARLVLRQAPVEVMIPKSTVLVKVDATYIGAVYEIAARLGADASGEDYGADGSLSVSLTCETSVLEQLKTGLQDSTRGEAIFSEAHQ